MNPVAMLLLECVTFYADNFLDSGALFVNHLVAGGGLTEMEDVAAERRLLAERLVAFAFELYPISKQEKITMEVTAHAPRVNVMTH